MLRISRKPLTTIQRQSILIYDHVYNGLQESKKDDSITISNRSISMLRSLTNGNRKSYERPTNNIHWNQSSISHQLYNQIRYFGKRGRKGAAMGHHIEKLKEIAHREAKKSKEKKDNSAKKMNSNKESKVEENTQVEMDEDLEDLEDDEDEEDEENDETIPSLPSVDKLSKRMQSAVESLEKSFRTIRGADPTPELFENIQVSAYGSVVPLNTLAQVFISSPSMAVLTCYDPSTAKNVRDAIRDSGMNFNPRIDENATGEVHVPIPKVSMETRMILVKQLHNMVDRHKARIRNIRKRANDKIKKAKDGKIDGISKDDAFRVGKDIDQLTHDMNEKMMEMLAKKEKTIKGK